MFCRKCGAQISDDSVFCGKCGTRVEPVIENTSNTAQVNNNMNAVESATQEFICPNCGGRVTVENGWYICHNGCGYKYQINNTHVQEKFADVNSEEDHTIECESKTNKKYIWGGIAFLVIGFAFFRGILFYNILQSLVILAFGGAVIGGFKSKNYTKVATGIIVGLALLFGIGMLKDAHKQAVKQGVKVGITNQKKITNKKGADEFAFLDNLPKKILPSNEFDWIKNQWGDNFNKVKSNFSNITEDASPKLPNKLKYYQISISKDNILGVPYKKIRLVTWRDKLYAVTVNFTPKEYDNYKKEKTEKELKDFINYRKNALDPKTIKITETLVSKISGLLNVTPNIVANKVVISGWHEDCYTFNSQYTIVRISVDKNSVAGNSVTMFLISQDLQKEIKEYNSQNGTEEGWPEF